MNKEKIDFTFFENKPTFRTLFIHISLFIATFFATCLSGALWGNVNFLELSNWQYGITYSILILTFLTSHEFGHYIAARIYGVDATLPFYIPFPPSSLMPSFGTFGAVIKMRSPIPSRKALFDIGIAGPLAGFVVCFIFLIIGFITLPPKDYIYVLHPEYLTMFNGEIPAVGLHFGNTILFNLLSSIFGSSVNWIPPMNEIYHFPFLNVGWFGLFVTSLNLLPIGQLDGGHVTYAMFGKNHKRIAKVVWYVLILIGSGSVLNALNDALSMDYANVIFLFFQNNLKPVLEFIDNMIPGYYNCWGGWLFWALITKFFIKLEHPPIQATDDIGNTRRILGWVAIAIFILCFSWDGIFYIE